MRGYRLTGPARGRGLDVLHLRAEVVGAQETEEAIHVWVRGALPALPADVFVDALPEEERLWTGLEDDRPVSVGRQILVRPPWVPAPPGFTGVELVVPRGSAFGSGEHGSTRAALAVLEDLWPDELRSLADIGTGSGILALYALQRGCPLVMACDLDPAAVRAARALLPRALVVEGGPRDLPGAADGIVANLAASELHEVLEDVLSVWTRRGPLVLSGMRDAEVDALAGRVPYAPVVRRAEDDFHALGWNAPRATVP